MARAAARRLYRAPAAVTHLLWRQVLCVSAEGLGGAHKSRHRRERPVRAVVRLQAGFSQQTDPWTFHDWVANQFGERLFSIFFKTYTEKVWGMSCDEISADWAAQRIKGLDLRSAIRNALRRSQFGNQASAERRRSHQDADRELRVSAQGPRHDVGGRGRASAGAGRRDPMGHVLEKPVVGSKAKTVDHHCQELPESAASFKAQIMSFPRHRSASLCSITPRPVSKPIAESLRYRDFVTVALVVDKPDLFPDNWIYIHDPSVKSAASRTSAPGHRKWCPTRALLPWP